MVLVVVEAILSPLVLLKMNRLREKNKEKKQGMNDFCHFVK